VTDLQTPPPGIDASELAIPPGASVDEAVAATKAWVEANVPLAWRDAADRGGRDAIRAVRAFSDYEAWYPTFARSGLAVATWPVAYGGLDLKPAVARAVEAVLAPYNLGRLNPLGLNLAAPALFAFGTEEQRLRFLPPMVRNDEVWCQLFSEPGAGSDLASLACKAERDGDEWVLTGQKVWSTWAHNADYGVLLARTDPDQPKRKGISYFLVDLHQPGVEVRALRHITGEVDFNETFLDAARVPDFNRVGEIGDGWKVANATLSGERQMVSGAGSGGVDRIGGSGAEHLIEIAKANTAAGLEGGWDDPVVRQQIMRLLSEERIRGWTNQRVRAGLKAGRSPGPESSIGKVHQGSLNQRIQALATDLLGARALAWETGAVDATDPAEAYGLRLPRDVKGMLRSRANTIEGGTSEVNKNILGERVLGLPREPDQYQDAAWRDVPRS
jgi:alkylation response protein AidB-like acyl-CoA dehydrogenase